jgi:hypothetical protein
MTHVGTNSAAAAAEPGAFMPNPTGGVDALRKHVHENFGATLAPVLETMIYRRGWHNCNVDEFHAHLQQNATGIVTELSRQLNELDLIMGIEENLLKALFLTHGQAHATMLIQAMRNTSILERFEAILHPAKLLKLVAHVQQPQPRSMAPAAASISSGAYGAGSSSYPRTSQPPLGAQATLPAGLSPNSVQPYRSTPSSPNRGNSTFEELAAAPVPTPTHTMNQVPSQSQSPSGMAHHSMGNLPHQSNAHHPTHAPFTGLPHAHQNLSPNSPLPNAMHGFHGHSHSVPNSLAQSSVGVGMGLNLPGASPSTHITVGGQSHAHHQHHHMHHATQGLPGARGTPVGNPTTGWNVPMQFPGAGAHLSPYPSNGQPNQRMHNQAQTHNLQPSHLDFELGNNSSQQRADALMSGMAFEEPIAPTFSPSNQQHHLQPVVVPRQRAPAAPPALVVDDADLSLGQPVSAASIPSIAPIGFTPTKQGPGAALPTPNMNWADATEEEEYQRQRAAKEQERNEAELKAFLDKHEQGRLFDALKSYSLSKLKSFSFKQFEAELKVRICSKAARQQLLEILHPDGVYPPDPPVETPKPASQQGKPLAAVARVGVAPDLASTKALLGALNVKSPEKERLHSDPYRDREHDRDRDNARHSTRRYEEEDEEEYDYRRDDRDRDRRNGGVGRTETSHRRSYDETEEDYRRGGRTDPRSGAQLARKPYDRDYRDDRRDYRDDRKTAGRQEDRRRYQDDYEEADRGHYRDSRDARAPERERERARDQPQPRSSRAPATPALELPAPRHGRREGSEGYSPTKPERAERDYHRDDSRDSKESAFRPGGVVVTLSGTRSITMDEIVNAIGKYGTVVSESFKENDEAEVELSSYSLELLSSRYISVRQNGVSHKLKVASILLKKTGRLIVHTEQNFNQPCKYYLSKEGCNRGEDCKYLHEDQAGDQGHSKGSFHNRDSPKGPRMQRNDRTRSGDSYSPSQSREETFSSDTIGHSEEREPVRERPAPAASTITPPLPRSQTPPPLNAESPTGRHGSFSDRDTSAAAVADGPSREGTTTE